MRPVSILTVTAFVVLNFVLFSVSVSQCFGEDPKFGYVSMSSISKKSKRLIASVAEVNQMLGESNAKATALASEIKAMDEELKKGKDALKPDDEKKMREEMKDKKEELEGLQMDVRAKASFKKKSVENVLRTQLPTALETVARQEKVSLIFWKESLAYVSGIPDLSDKVAAALDAMPALEKGPEAELPVKP